MPDVAPPTPQHSSTFVVPSDSPLIPYCVRISTASLVAASTDHQVFITLNGDLGSTPPLPLHESPSSPAAPSSPTHSERFPINSVREFTLQHIDVGNILSITLLHDSNDDPTAAWKPEKVVVEHGVINRAWTFICPRWLSAEHGNKAYLHPAGDVAVGRRASRRASRRISNGKDDTGSMILHSPRSSPSSLPLNSSTSSPPVPALSSPPINGHESRRRFVETRELFDTPTDALSKSTTLAPVSAGTEAGTKRVYFQLQKFSRSDAHLYLTGSTVALGSWEPKHACRMHQHCGLDGSWRGEWRLEIEIDDDFDEIHYAYMIVSHSGTQESRVATITQPMRTLILSGAGQQASAHGDRRMAEGGRIYIKDHFNNTNDHTNTVPLIRDNANTTANQSDISTLTNSGSMLPPSPQVNRNLNGILDAQVVGHDPNSRETVSTAPLSQRQQIWARAGQPTLEIAPEVDARIMTPVKVASRGANEMSADSTTSGVEARNSRNLSANGDCSPISADNAVLDDQHASQRNGMVSIAQTEVTRLREDRDSMQADRNRAVTDRDALKLELDDLKVEMEATVRERNSWRSQFDNLKKNFASNNTSELDDSSISSSGRGSSAGRDFGDIVQLQEEVESLKKERDEILEKLGNVTKERDDALLNSNNDEDAAQKLAMASELTEIKTQLEEITKERDDLRAQLDDALKLKESLEQDMVQVRADADKKLESASKLAGEHESIVHQLESVKTELADKQNELEAQAVNHENILIEKEASHRAVLNEKEEERADVYDRWVKEFRERRKLFNTVQELRGNIRVFCRVRPSKENSTREPAVKFPDDNLDEHGRVALGGKPFEFDRVFQPASSQQEVYDETAGVVASVIDGYNVCVFAYGQTGSGKTYTMDGVDNDRGVNYRALQSLFDIADERQAHSTITIAVSMLEIYNENLRDLILPEERASNPPKLDIRKDGSSSSATAVHVPNLTEVNVDSFEQVWDVMHYGSDNRSKGRTDMNEHSSRSHLIVRVAVHCEDSETGVKTRGVLHLVDLAGSERVSRSNASGDRLKEAQHINKSLSSLGDVFAALTKNQGGHVPYRNSKLTYLLQDSLGGDSKTLMFVNVSSDERDGSETLSSLQFAQRVSKVELGNAKKHAERGPDPKVLQEKESENAELFGKLQSLQRELNRRDECISEIRERNRGLKGEVSDLKDQVEHVAAKENSNREGNAKEVRELKAAREKDSSELKEMKMRMVDFERKRDEEFRRLNSLIKSREQEVAKLSVQKSSEDHLQRLQAQLYAQEKEIRELRNNNNAAVPRKPGDKPTLSGSTGASVMPASIPGPTSMLGRPLSVPSSLGKAQPQTPMPKGRFDRSTPQLGGAQRNAVPKKGARPQRTSSSLPGTITVKSRHVRFEAETEQGALFNAHSADDIAPTPVRSSMEDSRSAVKSSVAAIRRGGLKSSTMQPPRRAKDVATPMRSNTAPRGPGQRVVPATMNGSVVAKRTASYSYGTRTNPPGAPLTNAYGARTNPPAPQITSAASDSGSSSGASDSTAPPTDKKVAPGSSLAMARKPATNGRMSKLPRSQTTLLRPPQRARPPTNENSGGNAPARTNSSSSTTTVGGSTGPVPSSGTVNGKLPLRRAGTISNLARPSGVFNNSNRNNDNSSN